MINILENYYFKIPIIGDCYFELFSQGSPIDVYDNFCGNFYKTYDGLFSIRAYENLVHFSLYFIDPKTNDVDFTFRYKILTNSLDEDFEEMTQAFVSELDATENPFCRPELKYEIMINSKRNYVTEWLCEKFEVIE